MLASAAPVDGGDRADGGSGRSSTWSTSSGLESPQTVRIFNRTGHRIPAPRPAPGRCCSPHLPADVLQARLLDWRPERLHPAHDHRARRPAGRADAGGRARAGRRTSRRARSAPRRWRLPCATRTAPSSRRSASSGRSRGPAARCRGIARRCVEAASAHLHAGRIPRARGAIVTERPVTLNRSAQRNRPLVPSRAGRYQWQWSQSGSTPVADRDPPVRSRIGPSHARRGPAPGHAFGSRPRECARTSGGPSVRTRCAT